MTPSSQPPTSSWHCSWPSWSASPGARLVVTQGPAIQQDTTAGSITDNSSDHGPLYAPQTMWHCRRRFRRQRPSTARAGDGVRKHPEPGEITSHDQHRPNTGRPATAHAAGRLSWESALKASQNVRPSTAAAEPVAPWFGGKKLLANRIIAEHRGNAPYLLWRTLRRHGRRLPAPNHPAEVGNPQRRQRRDRQPVPHHARSRARTCPPVRPLHHRTRGIHPPAGNAAGHPHRHPPRRTLRLYPAALSAASRRIWPHRARWHLPSITPRA